MSFIEETKKILEKMKETENTEKTAQNSDIEQVDNIDEDKVDDVKHSDEEAAQRKELPSNIGFDFEIAGIVTCRGRDYILIDTAEFGIMRVEIEDNAFNPFERLKVKDKLKCKGTLTQGNFVKIL